MGSQIGMTERRQQVKKVHAPSPSADEQTRSRPSGEEESISLPPALFILGPSPHSPSHAHCQATLQRSPGSTISAPGLPTADLTRPSLSLSLQAGVLPSRKDQVRRPHHCIYLSWPRINWQKGYYHQAPGAAVDAFLRASALRQGIAWEGAGRPADKRASSWFQQWQLRAGSTGCRRSWLSAALGSQTAGASAYRCRRSTPAKHIRQVETESCREPFCTSHLDR